MVQPAAAFVAWALSSGTGTGRGGSGPIAAGSIPATCILSNGPARGPLHALLNAPPHADQTFRVRPATTSSLSASPTPDVGPPRAQAGSGSSTPPTIGSADAEDEDSERKTLKAYNVQLSRHAKRGEATEAEALLEEMHGLHASGGLDEAPDIVSFASVMDALARSCGDRRGGGGGGGAGAGAGAKAGGSDALERAEALATRLTTYADLGGEIRPNLHFFNALLNCYAERGDADGAERLLEEMGTLHTRGMLDGGPPDATSFGTAVKALANSGIKRRVAVPRAEALLGRLEEDDAVRPTCQAYVTLLKLYARWGMGGKAEKLLRRMENLHWAGRLDGSPPNVIAYTAALNAWARSRDRSATDRAAKLFRRMEEDRTGRISPDVVAFNSLLRCYASRGLAHDAELLLMRMEGIAAAGKLGGGGRGRDEGRRDGGASPDRISYTTVLTALAKSKDADAPDRAVALLDRMRELHAAGGRRNLEPDEITYACCVRCMLRGKDHRSVEPFEQAVLMGRLQIEEWPFPRQAPLPWT